MRRFLTLVLLCCGMLISAASSAKDASPAAKSEASELPPQVRDFVRHVYDLSIDDVWAVAVDGEPWVWPVRTRYKLPRARSAKKHTRGK